MYVIYNYTKDTYTEYACNFFFTDTNIWSKNFVNGRCQYSELYVLQWTRNRNKTSWEHSSGPVDCTDS